MVVPHGCVTTYELRKKEFALNSEVIKQAIGIQYTFILEIKLQKENFLGNHFSVSEKSLLGWGCEHSYHDLRTEKGGIYRKQSAC